MGSSVRVHEFTVAASAAFGLAIGSFLNVVIYRLPRHLSVAHPPSHCPSCGSTLSPLDNVPLVSWLILRGRCRTCLEPISARYPLVEASNGLAFGLVAAWTRPFGEAVAVMVLCAAAIVAAGIDVDRIRVPRWILIASGAALVALAGLGVGPSRAGEIRNALAGGAVGAAVMALSEVGSVRRLRRTNPNLRVVDGRMVFLVGALGAAASWFWWPSGLVLAGFVAATTPLVVTGVLGGRPTPPDPAIEGEPPELQVAAGVPLALIAAAFIALVVAGAAIH